MVSVLDPTKSRTLRAEYAALLKGFVGKQEENIIRSLEKLVTGNLVIVQFAKTVSYDSQKLISSMKTKISREDKELITRLIKFQAMMRGVTIGLSQAKKKGVELRGVTGQFINRGTAAELVNLNLSMVKSVLSQHIERVRLLLARFIGGGTITWNTLIRGIKKQGRVTKKQAEVISRTEIVRAISAGQRDVLVKAGFTKWKWVTAADERVCPICGPLHGKKVNIGRSFGMFRQQPVMHPPVHPNCRCGVEAV